MHFYDICCTHCNNLKDFDLVHWKNDHCLDPFFPLLYLDAKRGAGYVSFCFVYCSCSLGLFTSTVFYIASVMGIVLMYYLYASKLACSLNIFFITWTAVLLIVMMAISLHSMVCSSEHLLQSLKFNYSILYSGINSRILL